MDTDYIEVTEISGDEVSQEQVQRLCNRYYWATDFCKGKDVLEVACGTGQGLGYLNRVSKNFEAGDYSKAIINIAQNHYKERIKISAFDATNMPYEESSKDIVILFEAVYYLPDFEKFIVECKRVLREDGMILIATANKDLFDFNPSPFTYRYFGVKELSDFFKQHGFSVNFWGDTPVSEVSIIQKILRPVKKLAVKLNLVPKSMGAKKILKSLVFGGLTIMPAEITDSTSEHISPKSISAEESDVLHKVIFCAAQKK